MKKIILLLFFYTSLNSQIPEVYHNNLDFFIGKKFLIDLDQKPYSIYFLKGPKSGSGYSFNKDDLGKQKGVVYECFEVVESDDDFLKIKYLGFKNSKNIKFYIVHSFDMPIKPFEPLLVTDSMYCSAIRYEYDKFKKIKHYSSPDGNVVINKIIIKEDTSYILSLDTYSPRPTIENGVILLLDNEETMEWPDEKLSSSVTSSGFSIYASITLSDEDLIKLKNHLITDFQLYIHDVKVKNPEAIKNYINCIITK